MKQAIHVQTTTESRYSNGRKESKDVEQCIIIILYSRAMSHADRFRRNNTASNSIMLVSSSNRLFPVGHALATYHPFSLSAIASGRSSSLSASCTTVPSDGILQLGALHTCATLSSWAFARAWRPRLSGSIDNPLEEK
jgi:hypothetical protein